MKNDFDVDIVIPWVDGGDKKWQEEKNKYLPEDKKFDIDAAANRYRDWDNLQYVFRSIEKFAPWVRKVFFVTCGQVPKWLNTKCEKLVLVNHKDYIPNECLPTFSANPIEINMHRIKGLSEHFIYMNDDFFFTNKTEKEDFFKNELPRIVAVERPFCVSQDVVFSSIVTNDLRLIDSVFNKRETKKKFAKKFYKLSRPKDFVYNKMFDYIGKNGWMGFLIEHIPAPFLKSSIEECWNVFGDKLNETSKNKFRSIYDVNQYLFTEYMLCTGKFESDKFGRKGVLLNVDDTKEGNVDFVCQTVRKQKHKTVCINDAMVENFEETKKKINEALDSILSDKSSFEL